MRESKAAGAGPALRWLGTVAAALLLSQAGSAVSTRAADLNGNFAISGAGALACSDYVVSKTDNPERYRAYLSWMSGFFTAYNAASPQTYDILPWHAPELIAAVVADQCREFPDKSFASAVLSVAKALEPQRLTLYSEKVTVENGSVNVRIYRTVLRRIQERLAEQGFFDGTVNGEPGAETVAALLAFQRKHDLKQTGLPDQFTLWRLFQGKHGK